MVRNPSRVVAALLAGILGIGALCRIWGLDFGLPYTQARPGETYIIDVAPAVPPVFFTVWAIALLIAAPHERRGARFAAAGLIAGLAAATKYSALLLAVPITASYVLHVMNGSRGQAERDRRVLVFGAAFLAG